jgi:1,4-dihydroxy-2-naphthoate octaprenyltransferase
MQGYEQYIKPELGIVIALLYVIGSFIKNTEKVSDKWIPTILGVLGVVVCLFYVLGSEGISMLGIFTAVTQGVLCAGAAVYVNQLIKQSSK